MLRRDLVIDNITLFVANRAEIRISDIEVLNQRISEFLIDTELKR
jgi:hypothetical protein